MRTVAADIAAKSRRIYSPIFRRLPADIDRYGICNSAWRLGQWYCVAAHPAGRSVDQYRHARFQPRDVDQTARGGEAGQGTAAASSKQMDKVDTTHGNTSDCLAHNTQCTAKKVLSESLIDREMRLCGCRRLKAGEYRTKNQGGESSDCRRIKPRSIQSFQCQTHAPWAHQLPHEAIACFGPVASRYKEVVRGV